jgi:hypothetical protein
MCRRCTSNETLMGVRERTVHGSQLHREVDNDRFGLLPGGETAWRNPTGREIQVDTEGESSKRALSFSPLSLSLTQARDIAFSVRADERPLLAAVAHRDRHGELQRRRPMRRNEQAREPHAIYDGTFSGSAGNFAPRRHSGWQTKPRVALAVEAKSMRRRVVNRTRWPQSSVAPIGR